MKGGRWAVRVVGWSMYSGRCCIMTGDVEKKGVVVISLYVCIN